MAQCGLRARRGLLRAGCLAAASIFALAQPPGDCQDALERIAQASRGLPSGDPLWADIHHALGRQLRQCGRLEEAEVAYRRSLEIAGRDPGGGQHRLLAAMELAILFVDQGRIEAGARLLEQIEKDIKSAGAPASFAADWQQLSGIVALARGRHEEAERHFLAAESARLAVPDAPADRTVSLHVALASTAAAGGNLARARRRAEQALGMLDTLNPEESEADARAVINLAGVHSLLEDPRRAEPLLRLAVRLAAQYPSVPLPVRALLAESHVKLLEKLGRKREAKAARAGLQAIRRELAEAERRRHAVDFQELIRAAKR